MLWMIIGATVVVFCAAIGVSCCMLSGKISREEEQQEICRNS